MLLIVALLGHSSVMSLLIPAPCGAKLPHASRMRCAPLRILATSTEPEKAQGGLKSKPPAYAYLEGPYANYLDGYRPAASWKLASDNLARQGKSIIIQLAETTGLRERDALRPPASLGLTLSNDSVKEAERLREERGGRVDAHPVSRALYDVGCLILDNLFDGRPIQRFWFLEIVARIPYFSYVSMLHLYESFGWWRDPQLRKLHHAQEWNELHHLLIMESLGGNSLWSDRFLGYHVSFLYYWFLNAVFLCSPRIAYEFSEVSSLFMSPPCPLNMGHLALATPHPWPMPLYCSPSCSSSFSGSWTRLCPLPIHSHSLAHSNTSATPFTTQSTDPYPPGTPTQLLEAHAVDTYSTFVNENKERLSELPPPAVASSYYTVSQCPRLQRCAYFNPLSSPAWCTPLTILTTSKCWLPDTHTHTHNAEQEGDLYYFDDFQMRPPGSRRPVCNSLRDVFENICEDEVALPPPPFSQLPPSDLSCSPYSQSWISRTLKKLSGLTVPFLLSLSFSVLSHSCAHTVPVNVEP